MSYLKIFLIVAVVLAALLMIGIVYSLSPTVRNVTDEPIFRSFLNRPLTLKKISHLFRANKGQYEINEKVLTQEDRFDGQLISVLLPASEITIVSVKPFEVA